VIAVEDLLTGSPDVRVHRAPGGHLGVLTGRGARRSSWLHLDEFLSAHDVAPERAQRATEKVREQELAAAS
jgi:hypothetical protein